MREITAEQHPHLWQLLEEFLKNGSDEPLPEGFCARWVESCQEVWRDDEEEALEEEGDDYDPSLMPENRLEEMEALAAALDPETRQRLLTLPALLEFEREIEQDEEKPPVAPLVYLLSNMADIRWHEDPAVEEPLSKYLGLTWEEAKALRDGNSFIVCLGSEETPLRRFDEYAFASYFAQGYNAFIGRNVALSPEDLDCLLAPLRNEYNYLYAVLTRVSQKTWRDRDGNPLSREALDDLFARVKRCEELLAKLGALKGE